MKLPVRYRVRNRDGDELIVPSLADLVALYQGGFLEDDDLVRQENATVWTRCGAMGALHGVRERRRDSLRTALLLAAVVVFAVALGLLLAR